MDLTPLENKEGNVVKCLCSLHDKPSNNDTIKVLEPTGEYCEFCKEPTYNFEYIYWTAPNVFKPSTLGKRCFNPECATFNRRLFSQKLIDMLREYGVKPGSLFPAAP